MKRLDRSKELARNRLRSAVIWLAIGGWSVGLWLLSEGHDNGDPFLSVIGILVFLGAGGFFFLPMLFRRGERKTPDRVKSRRSRFRAILFFIVIGCALATAGLLLYGLEYADVMVVDTGVLVMWLGIAFFVPLVFTTPSKVPSQTHRWPIRVSISNLADARSVGLEWPNTEQGLWFGIYGLNIVHSLDTQFLIANTPGDHMIFFAVSTWEVQDEHKELKDLLERSSNQYREEFDGSRKDKWHTIFASTRDENVIRHVFENYEFYYGSYATYPFIVAKGELSAWIDSLRRLCKKGLHGITREMVENSHCVIITAWEHGLEMFTDKVPEEYILKVAKEIANDNSLPLLNIADETEQAQSKTSNEMATS